MAVLEPILHSSRTVHSRTVIYGIEEGDEIFSPLFQ